MNAIMNKNTASLSGAVSQILYSLPCTLHKISDAQATMCERFMVLQRLYVTMFPCNECAKLLIQAGITEVVFYEVSIAVLLPILLLMACLCIPCRVCLYLTLLLLRLS